MLKIKVKGCTNLKTVKQSGEKSGNMFFNCSASGLNKHSTFVFCFNHCRAHTFEREVAMFHHKGAVSEQVGSRNNISEETQETEPKL